MIFLISEKAVIITVLNTVVVYKAIIKTKQFYVAVIRVTSMKIMIWQKISIFYFRELISQKKFGYSLLFKECLIYYFLNASELSLLKLYDITHFKSSIFDCCTSILILSFLFNYYTANFLFHINYFCLLISFSSVI